MTDPTSRALQLLGLLESRPVWGGADLAERLGVTTRTVRRDVERLRELGYTVNAAKGLDGGYALGRGQVLPPLLLDDDEAAAVTLALISAATGATGTDADASLRALGKLDDVMPAALRHRLQRFRDAVDVVPTSVAVSASTLMSCAEGVRRQQRLDFDYRDRRGTGTRRHVEPYRVGARGRVWRLVAYDLDRDDWRTFRLDRMTNPRIGTWRFTPRPGADAATARLDEPIPSDAWRHRVEVHIHAGLDVVAADIPHRAGRLRSLGPDLTEFVGGEEDPAQAAWWLARIRHDFTVVGDEQVRQAVADLGSRLSAAAADPTP